MKRQAWLDPTILWAGIVILFVAFLLTWHPWRSTQTRVVVSHYSQGFAAGEKAGFNRGMQSGTDLGCELGAEHLFPPDEIQSLRDGGASGSWCKRLRSAPRVQSGG